MRNKVVFILSHQVIEQWVMRKKTKNRICLRQLQNNSRFWGKNTEAVCHSLLQWTTYCQNSSPWPIHSGWACKVWLIAALSYTRLWSMRPFSLDFYEYDFHPGSHRTVLLDSSVCPLMDEDKTVVQASWWEGLTVGKTESCPGGQGYAQSV